VEIVPRANAEAALTAIGGTGGCSLLARARAVELAIYQISAALIPPDIEEVDCDAAAVYRPFDVIEAIRVTDGEGVLTLRPLAIFDDAHSLHPQQLAALTRWLSRRELKVARWVLMRFDALTPGDVLLDRSADAEEPGLKRGRDITGIWMQSSEERVNQRRAFRKMAKDMAGRYLSQMEVFNRRRLHSLGDLLSTTSEVIAAGKRTQLAEHVDGLQRRYGLSAERRRGLEHEVDVYLAGARENGEDVRLAMLVSCSSAMPSGSLNADCSRRLRTTLSRVGRSRPMPALPMARAFICCTSTIVRTSSASILYVMRVRKTPSNFFN